MRLTALYASDVLIFRCNTLYYISEYVKVEMDYYPCHIIYFYVD